MSKDMRVSIDRDFARFGNKSFAINKINTVEVVSRRPYSQNAFFGWGLLAAISLLLFVGGSVAASLLALLLVAFFSFLGFRAWQRRKILEYQLFLVTSSGAVQAIKSEDSSMIAGLRDKTEQAVAGRLG